MIQVEVEWIERENHVLMMCQTDEDDDHLNSIMKSATFF